MPTKDLKAEIEKKLNDTVLRGALGRFAEAYPISRANAYANIDCDAARDKIQKTKSWTVDNIMAVADQFEAEATKRGTKVFRAKNGDAVKKYIIDLCKSKGLQRVVKSKSMASEEIHLNHSLEEAGLHVKETDLGEWIISLAGHTPSHMVMPAIHLDRHQIRDYFSEELEKDIPVDIAVMVQEARQALRGEFLTADLGISGANFGIAENGAIGLVTNEGNARLTSSMPKVHVVLMGYEKLIPKIEDAAPILMTLPRSATGQLLTSYVSMMSGPTNAVAIENGEEKIIEKEVHIILFDNGRLDIAKDPDFKQVYNCVRCASCLNVCPVYLLIGGHAYGHIYAGGIGAILTAFLNEHSEVDVANKIQELCLSCGKCREICPGRIDIPGLIYKLREKMVKKDGLPFAMGVMFRTVMANRKLFHSMLRLGALGSAPFKSDGMIRHLPLFLNGMVKERSLPAIAATPFRDRVGEITRKINKPRAKAAFFSGCTIDFVYPEIGESVYKVLQDCNVELVYPQDQSCCGAPVSGAGDTETLLELAKQNIKAFEDAKVDYILTACPTCAEYTGHKYKDLFENDAEWAPRAAAFSKKVRDFNQVVAEYYEQDGKLAPQPEGPGKIKVTYHDSCHMKRTLGIHEEPRKLLNAAKGYEYAEMKDADVCCGMAGAFGMKFPELSLPIIDKKIGNIKATEAEVVAVGCPACMMQIRGSLDKKAPHIKTKHVAEILAGR
jgi:L-lactate dehydrogenase complex protein LldF